MPQKPKDSMNLITTVPTNSDHLRKLLTSLIKAKVGLTYPSSLRYHELCINSQGFPNLLNPQTLYSDYLKRPARK